MNRILKISILHKTIIMLLILVALSINILFAQGICTAFITDNSQNSCLELDPKGNLIIPNQLIACQGSTIKYKANIENPFDSIISVLWSVSGEDTFVLNNDNTITITWDSGSVGYVDATINTINNYQCSTNFTINLISNPIANSTSIPDYSLVNNIKTIEVCQGEDIYFNDITEDSNNTITGYYWQSPYGNTNTKDYVIHDINQDIKVIHRVYSNCGCYSQEIYMVKVLTGEKLLLSCYGTVCKDAVSNYSSLNINCPSNQYNWSIQGGQILNGQGTNDITVLWNNPINGYGTINLNSHICGEHYCPKLLTVQIPIIDDLLEINGKDTICINKGENYSLPLYGDTYYNWQINPPNGWTKRDNNGANDISLYFNIPGTYTLSAQYKCEFLNCGEYTTKIKNIVVKDSLRIMGQEKICLSLTDSFYLNQNINALWEVYFLPTDSLIYSQQSNNLIFNFPSNGQYTIKASHPNYCNTAEFIVEVINPPNPPTIGEIPLRDTIEVCKYSSTKLLGITDNPRYSFVWETTCENANPTNYSGNEVTITFEDSVCDVKVYKYDKLLGCKSQRFYTQHIKELKLKDIALRKDLKVCSNTLIDWTNNQIPFQDNTLYYWFLDTPLQKLASFDVTNFSNKTKIFINNFTSAQYPYSFNVYLSRTACENTKIDTINITVVDTIGNRISISSTADSICIGKLNTLTADTTNNPWASDFCWTNNYNSPSIYGNPIYYNCIHAGNNKITLTYNSLNYCDNNDFYLTDSINIYVTEPIGDINLSLDTINNTITANTSVTDTIGWEYSWEKDNSIIPGSISRIISYLGSGYYCCTIKTTDNCTQQKCQQLPTQSSAERDSCQNAEIEMLNQGTDICQGIVKYRVVDAYSHVNWQIDSNVQNIQNGYYNDTITLFYNEAKAYIIGATYTRNNTCYSNSIHGTIPLLLDFNLYNVSCGIRIRNNTSSIKNIPITCYISKNGSLIDSLIIESKTQYANYYTTDSGMYQVLFINDTYNCSFMDSIYFTPSTNIPHFEISTSNTLDSTTTCNHQPIELTIYCKENRNRPIYSTTWLFGDSTTFHNSYNKISHLFSFNGDPSNSKYNIFAEVLDTNGCYYYSDTLKLISVSDSGNLIQQYEFVPQLICPGQAKTITINVNHTYPDNNIFYWQPQNIVNYNINTIDVYNTNTYKVRVTNQTYCQAEALKTIPFLNCPTANICSEKQYYCQADNMILSAQDGNTTTQYLWSITDSNGLNILSANTPTIQIPNIAPNIYTTILRVSDQASHCFNYDTMTIKVYPSPNAPQLDFGNNKCIDNPPVILTTAANSPANKVYWNNGMYGHSAKYYSSSWATAYYYDTINGCKSQTAKIYINPSPNFDALLTGCYNYCGPYPYLMKIAGLTMDTNILDWTWICNSNPISSGSGYYYNSILPLNIPQNGIYKLNAVYNNGHCVTKSPQLILDNTDCIYIGGGSGGSGQGNYIPCNPDIDVFYKINIMPNSCPWQFSVVVTICNNSSSTVCINYIDSPYKNIMQNLYISNSNFTIPPNDCASTTIYFEIISPLITSIPFEFYDSFNNCWIKTNFDIKIPEEPCQTNMSEISMTANSQLTNSYTAYIDFDFDLLGNSTVFYMWSEPNQIINWYNYQSPTNSFVRGLCMFDVHILEQFKNSKKDICFYAYVCENSQMCLKKYCISSQVIYHRLLPYIESMTTDNSIYLYFDSSTKQNKLIGIQENDIKEILVLDDNGNCVNIFYDINALNTSDLNLGRYIIRLVTLEDKVYYVTLIINKK